MIYVAARVLAAVLGVATTAILTHLLAPTVYGVYGLALVVMSFGSDAAFSWLGISFMRFYQSRPGDPRLTGTFLLLFYALVGLTAVLAALAWAFGIFAGSAAAVYAIGIALMWSYSWFEFVARFEIASFHPTRYLLMNVGRALTGLIATVGAAWFTRDPVWTVAGTALGMLVGSFLRGFGRLGVSFSGFDRKLALAVLAFGAPMAASMVLGSLINSGTRWLIQELDSAQALGFYTAAFMLVQNTLALIGSGIASAGYSLAVRAVEEGKSEITRKQLLANSTLLLAVLAPATLGLVLTSHGLARTLIGAQYVASVASITPWMAVGTGLFAFRANYLDHAFQLGRRPGLQVWVSALTAIVAVGLSFWLIPKYGPLGAAVAVAVAMVISCAHAWILGHYAYTLPFPVAQSARIGAACTAMGIVVVLIPGSGPVSFPLQVALGASVYVGTALALDVMNVRDRTLAFIAELLRRRLPGRT